MAYIDTHKMFNELVNAGFSNVQAELLSKSFLASGNEEIAKEQTEIKSDIKVMQADIANIKENIANMVTKAEFKAKMIAVENELKNEISSVKAELKSEIALLNTKINMLMWMIPILVTILSIAPSLINYLK